MEAALYWTSPKAYGRRHGKTSMRDRLTLSIGLNLKVAF